MKTTDIIIPAYNEETRIAVTLTKYLNILSKRGYRLIIVANNCSDKTPEIVADLEKKDKRIKLINIPSKIGKGGAIIEGLKLAKADIIGFIDADDTFEIPEITKLIDFIKNNDDYNGIIGSKWKSSSFFKNDQPTLRKIFGRGWNVLTRVLLNLKFEDTQCGAKFFKKNVIESIKEREFNCKGFAFDAELLFAIKNKGFKIKEQFIPSHHIADGTFDLSYIYPMFRDLVKLRLRRKQG